MARHLPGAHEEILDHGHLPPQVSPVGLGKETLFLLPQFFVVADDFRDDEIQKLFSKDRVEIALFGERSQPLNLARFAALISRRHIVLSFQLAHRLGDFEALGQRVQQDRIEIIDACAILPELIDWGGHGH